MTTYIIKRIVLMIPTLFVISFMIFLVLNLAPGRPGGGSGGQGNETAQSQEARESYRIFKEQFNFDKPVIFNARFTLTEADVEREVRILADFQAPICPAEGEATPGCIPEAQKPEVADIIKAEELLEDWGHYIVPQLIQIADTADRLDMQKIALRQLSTNAKRRLLNEYGKQQTPEQREANKAIHTENEMVSKWRLPAEADAATVDAMMNENWKPWFEEHRHRYEYGLGEKIVIFFTDTRFAKYWENLFTLDFGVSHVDKRPVMEKIIEKVPYTLTLNFFAILLAYIISVPLGVWSAYRQDTPADRVMTIVLFLLYSLPSFFIAVLLLETLTKGTPLDIFPTGDFVGKFPEWYQPADRNIQSTDDLTTLEYFFSVSYHMVLPVFCLTYGALASLSRYARTGLLDVIRADYIRTARAKGLGEPMVIVKHAVRNGMIPVLTLLGTLLPALIGGSVVIEFVFNIPGMGLYIFESIFARDYNAIMAVLLISAVLTLIGLLITDISYAIVDPRISFD